MYVDGLKLHNVRTFVETNLEFVHPDQEYRPEPVVKKEQQKLLPKPRLPNVNLLLGDNGSGKSTILRSLAMTAFGPAVKESLVRDPGLVRRETNEGEVHALLRLHEQDGAPGLTTMSGVSITRKGELEVLEFRGESIKEWNSVYESGNEAFFVVGYGATRRVERAENLDMGARTKARFARAQRVQGLFEDSFSLIPLTSWLPALRKRNPGRHKQVVTLLNRMLKPGQYRFTGELSNRSDYLFESGDLQVPFLNMSDGYRAFIGWVADLLYHVCFGCPTGKKLVDSAGMVLVDEIDLHLHPKWQMRVIRSVARALPKMQFVFTSHSPLVAGSLEWMNIITLKIGPKTNRTRARRLKQSIHGLDADQILLSDFFGLQSTIAPAKKKQLDNLTDRIRAGDKEAPLQLIKQLSSGTEAE